jgi:hypothetical protein
MRIENVLEQRAKELRGWLETNGGNCWTEQRHLRVGTPEQIYWHFGYLAALRDVLAKLEQQVN